MTAKIVDEVFARTCWCPFAGAARGPNTSMAPTNNPNYKLSDRCIGDECCVWQDAGGERGYCGLVAT